MLRVKDRRRRSTLNQIAQVKWIEQRQVQVQVQVQDPVPSRQVRRASFNLDFLFKSVVKAQTVRGNKPFRNHTLSSFSLLIYSSF